MARETEDTLASRADRASAVRSGSPGASVSGTAFVSGPRNRPSPRYMDVMDRITIPQMRQDDTYKRGGRVKRTGPAMVHRGERVLTARQARHPAVQRALRRSKR